MINENFIYFGFFLLLLGNISYIRDVIIGKTKPNRVTFFIWGLAPLITFFSQYSQGVGIQSLLALGVGIFPAMIFIVSFLNKKSFWKVTKFDIVCGVLSFIGLILWIVTKIGNVAIIFSILADFLASLPTIKKSYFNPESENYWGYFTSTIFSIIILLTLKNWNFASYGFPIYMLVDSFLLTVLVMFDFKRIFKE